MSRRRPSIRARLADQHGFTLVELLVTLMIGMVVILGIFALTDVSMRSSARTSARVDANQRARVTLQRLMDQLHSACVDSQSPPIQPGSTGSTISFLHATGSAAVVTPARRDVTLAGSVLRESVYAGNPGTGPNWTFAATPTTRELLTGVSNARLGNPAVTVPLFQYFTYDTSGQMSSTPLPTPLSAADAARTVKVTVSFAAAPLNPPVGDTNAPINVTDSTLLRFYPAAEANTTPNVPCA